MNSGDGTNYSLTKAIIENHTISLNYQKEYTLYTDYSINDNGDWISDREPGVSLLALPYYIIGKALADDTNLPYQGTSYYQENLNEESKIQIWTYSALSFYVALLLSISFILLTKLKVKHSVILLYIVNVFFGSLLLKYSASFSRNAVLAVNNLVGLLSLVVFDKTKKKKYLTLVGFVFGVNAVCDYLSWISSLVIFLLIILKNKSFSRCYDFLSGFLPFLVVAFIYNYFAFGDFLVSPHSYEGQFTYMKEFVNNFKTPFWQGAWLNLFSFKAIPESAMPWLMNNNDICYQIGCNWARVHTFKGIFIQSPVLFLSLLGFFYLLKTQKKLFNWLLIYTLGIFLSYFIPMAKFTQFWSPNIYDSRHLLVIVPLLMMGLLALNYLDKKYVKHTMLIVAILSIISIKNSIVSVFTNFAPNLGGENRYSKILIKEDWDKKYFQNILINIFPNYGNLFAASIVASGLFFLSIPILYYLED